MQFVSGLMCCLSAATHGWEVFVNENQVKYVVFRAPWTESWHILCVHNMADGNCGLRTSADITLFSTRRVVSEWNWSRSWGWGWNQWNMTLSVNGFLPAYSLAVFLQNESFQGGGWFFTDCRRVRLKFKHRLTSNMKFCSSVCLSGAGFGNIPSANRSRKQLQKKKWKQ